MPSFGVIIGPNGLTITLQSFFGGGGGGRGDRAGNQRLATDVLNELLEGVCGGFESQPLERRVVPWCWKEGQGHQTPVGIVISGVSCCQSKI